MFRIVKDSGLPQQPPTSPPRRPEHALQVGRRIEEGAVQGIRRALPALEDTHLEDYRGSGGNWSLPKKH